MSADSTFQEVLGLIHPKIEARLEFDAIRVYYHGKLHIDIRRSKYLGLQSYVWPGYWAIEFVLAGGVLLVEYENEERFNSVLEALAGLKLSGQ